jgi:charged multivesicular body protein 3
MAFQGLFGPSKPKLTPKQQARAWDREFSRAIRATQREEKKIKREEDKIAKEIKKLAKDANRNEAAIRTMAKSMVKSRQTREKMLITAANIGSMQRTVQMQAATLSVTKNIGMATRIMGQLNQSMDVASISRTVQQMSAEMMKAGIASEMIEDAFEDSDIEEEADEEVDKIFFEITNKNLGDLQVGTSKLPEKEQEKVTEGDEELSALQARLANLSS